MKAAARGREDARANRTTRPAAGVVSALGGLLLAAALVPATARAQEADGRWLAWTGCWRPVVERPVVETPRAPRAGRMISGRPGADVLPADRPSTEAEAGEPQEAGAPEALVCLQPADDVVGLWKFTVEDGTVRSRETIRADGERHDPSAGECTGWERGELSSRPGRVYLTSELRCEGEPGRSTSGILAITSLDTWVEIEVVSSGGESGTWITRYVRANREDTEAAGFGELGPVRQGSIRAARVAASARPTVDDVIEASERVHPDAVEAWLVERDAALDLDADALARLADAGVPEGVIDVAIAVTYPERFAVDRGREEYGEYADAYGRRSWLHDPYYSPYYGPFFWSPFAFYARYGYPYRYGFGYPYGGRFGGFYGGGIRVIPISPRDRDSGGRVISGEGYRRGPGTIRSGGRTAQPRGGAIRPGTGRSAAPRRPSPSRSSGSTGRKAKKRGSGGGNGGEGRS